MSQIDYAFKALFGRNASDDEILFIHRKLDQLRRTLIEIMLIASNGFIYVIKLNRTPSHMCIIRGSVAFCSKSRIFE